MITAAFYQFHPLENLEILRESLRTFCKDRNLRGTLLLAPEGINGFVSGEAGAIEELKTRLELELSLDRLSWKVNSCQEHPFHRMLVKIKKEIISMGVPGIRPHERTGSYLSAEELCKWLDEGKEFSLLDTRNDYEVTVGTFERAKHLEVKSFREFATKSEDLSSEMKRKPLVMFCTGGIRCEKASALFMDRGFEEVYQLDGGILRYFERCGDRHFRGNCFVFDWRLAVDGNLAPAARLGGEKASGRHRIE